MEENLREYEDRLLQTEDGRLFLASYKSRVVSSVMKAFAAAAGEVEDLDPGALSPLGANSEDRDDVLEVAQNILDKMTATKEELKSISEMARERKQQNYTAVGDELQAITQDTEDATNGIMDSVDAIEGILKPLGGGGVLSEEALSEVLEKCGDIVIACSFQDITGQRVKKVVEVLQAIDFQISRIETQLNSPVDAEPDEVVGGLHDLSRERQKEDGLLDGPALPAEKATQDDIDSLFDGN